MLIMSTEERGGGEGRVGGRGAKSMGRREGDANLKEERL